MNIWVIRPGALGDTLLTIPLLYSIKSNSPNARVTLVGSRSYRELIPGEFGFKALDHPDSLWMFQPYHSQQKFNVKPCDVTYVILKDPQTIILNLLRAGVSRILIASPIPHRGLHLIETLHTQLGLPIPTRHPILRSAHVWESNNVTWVHPGSGGRNKLAPLRLFREVSRALQIRTGCDIVITLGDADAEIKIQEDWAPWLKESHANVLENHSLTEIRDRMSAAKFFLGNDSGISHLAACLGVFSILFFMSTDPIQWAPWVPQNQALILDYRARDLHLDIQSQADEIVNRALTQSLP